jgi:hypothetical protein
MATALDILPTLTRLANAPLPAGRLDGVDIWPLLSGTSTAVDRDMFLYFDGWNLQCCALGQVEAARGPQQHSTLDAGPDAAR